MSKIEVGLHEHHAAYQAAHPPGSSSTQAIRSNGSTAQGVLDTPFAKVNSVVDGSPADQAGLKAGDRIRKFGNVDFLNHEKLSKVAETVQRNQGVSTAIPWLEIALLLIRYLQRNVVVKVARGARPDQAPEELTLNLIPRSDWGGRGLLGCHLLPT